MLSFSQTVLQSIPRSVDPVHRLTHNYDEKYEFLPIIDREAADRLEIVDDDDRRVTDRHQTGRMNKWNG